TQFQLFPNPSNSSFNVRSSGIEMTEVKVYDQLGKVMLYQTNLGFTGEFNTAQWTSGVYFVQIKGANATFETHKLVVIH
ncbi:MAG: Secretion system C-terminal sorting domain, partial [Bacteroidota bacterium]